MTENPPADRVAKRCLISGKVQGVYYRASTQARARELGLHGHALNLADGRVEVLVCGSVSQVDALIKWMWKGPPAADVTRVEILDHEPTVWPHRFVIG